MLLSHAVHAAGVHHVRRLSLLCCNLACHQLGIWLRSDNGCLSEEAALVHLHSTAPLVATFLGGTCKVSEALFVMF